jgi:hypothetical protein
MESDDFDAAAFVRARACQLGVDVPEALLPAVAALLKTMAEGAASLQRDIETLERTRGSR